MLRPYFTYLEVDVMNLRLLRGEPAVLAHVHLQHNQAYNQQQAHTHRLQIPFHHLESFPRTKYNNNQIITKMYLNVFEEHKKKTFWKYKHEQADTL